MSDRHLNLTSPDGRHGRESPREDRLVTAMEEYRAAIDAGQSIDRQAFLGRYPDMARELAECLAGMEIIQGVAKQVSQAEFAQSAAELPDAQTLQALGDFQIVKELGRGGMGVVYEAQQLSLGRTVALKVLPFAAMLDDKQLQRFKNEARSAATLNHPNIVPVHFVGTERGVHFYAMQLIEGQSLAQIIAATRSDGGEKDPEIVALNGEAETKPVASLSTDYSNNPKRYYRTVAEIGVQIAEALGHAHQHGIIHRDVKPGNILVDKEGKPWITDFGLARADSDQSISISGDLLGTLRYMSPEQASGERHLVDDRADVYSLGATLYELATLRPAIDGAGRADLLASIISEDVTAPLRVKASIPSELETIVLKAIAKDPDERFASAQDMADDLRRHLQDLPIHARRPTLLERMIKKSRRHRAAMAFAGILTTVVMVGSIVSAALLWNEQRKTASALALARDEQTKAVQKAEEAQAISDFLVNDLLGSVDPKNAKGREVTVKEVVDNAEAKIDAAFKDKPLTEAAIRQTLARVLVGLGRYMDAKPQAERARELCIAHLGAEHVDTLAATHNLADVLRKHGVFEEAQKLIKEVLEKRRRILGAKHPDTLNTMNSLGEILLDQGEFQAAREIKEQLLETQRRVLGPEHPDTLQSMNELAIIVAKQGKLEEARKLFEEVLEKRRRILGAEHAATLKVMHNLATLLVEQDDVDGARIILEQVLDVAPRAIGPNHPDIVPSRMLAVGLLLREGKQDEALKLAKSMLEECRRNLGLSHPHTDAMMNNMAYFYSVRGEWEEACKIEEQLVETRWHNVGADRLSTFVAMGDLIEGRMAQEDIADLPGFSAETNSVVCAKEISPNIFFLATAHWHLGDKKEARRWYDKAVEWMDTHKPNDKELIRFRDEAAKLIGSNGEDKSPNDQED